ncbi:MAG: serine hydrolase [Bryobacteraceae bacterium]
MRRAPCLCALFATALAARVPWPEASPQSQGFDAARLEALRQSAADRHTRALLVARNGKLVLEWYAAGAGPDTKQGTASLAKAIIGGMSLLVALENARMKADDLASKYIPRWRNDPLKSKITIRMLATHTSGIQDAEMNGLPHTRLPGWMGAFWKRTPDPISIAIADAPVMFPPGSQNAYSNPGIAALAYAVTASLRGSPQPDIRSSLASLYDPIGIPESDWAISYGESYNVDGLNVYATWGGGSFTPRATARIGQLMLQKGVWNGRRVVKPGWVERVTRYAGMPLPDRVREPDAPGSGLCWWTNEDGAWAGVPRDAFAGAGAGQEMLLVVPSLHLVVVRNGACLSSAGEKKFWSDLVDYIFRPALESVKGAVGPPYAASPVIRSVSFAPPVAIVRRAIGSDNWPLTWARGGDLYTAYGDGWGFEPLLPQKLSLGIAKITGTPPDFHGVNLRSPSIERTGDGAAGPKASGLLMVDGVLYMWVRNTGNAQLAWSNDLGKTWRWGFRFEESFGSPSFLNCGPDYSGAPDSFVYSYSQIGPSAYDIDDSVALARVPRSKIRDRRAYQFFAGLTAGGAAKWTRDIAAQLPVFSFPGHCQRVDAIYHPGLRRYLLAIGYNHHSGWGLYDAPQPWGPWTTAFHTEHWDVTDTHGYRLTPKWSAKDGAWFDLVFSGLKQNDAFCVRRMNLSPAARAIHDAAR